MAASMNLKHVDIEGALRRLADRRIEEAMREGKFDNLPGAGQPLELDPIPAEENARLTWWALRILKNNDVVPDEVRWRKALDYLRARLGELKDESHLPAVVGQINDLVRRINTMGTNVMKAPAVAVDLEEERIRLRQRLADLRFPPEPFK